MKLDLYFIVCFKVQLSCILTDLRFTMHIVVQDKYGLVLGYDHGVISESCALNFILFICLFIFK